MIRVVRRMKYTSKQTKPHPRERERAYYTAGSRATPSIFVKWTCYRFSTTKRPSALACWPEIAPLLSSPFTLTLNR